MLPSWRLARNSLAGKPGRLALMVGAVAISCALVVAVSCAVASVQASLEAGITQFLGASDARLIHQFNGRFDQSLVEKVRSWPEVEYATGRLFSSLTLVHADGRVNEKGEMIRSTPTALGVDFPMEEIFRKPKYLAGGAPKARDEIILDPAAAEELRAKPGDVLEVQRFGEPILVKVAGVFDRPRLPAVQRPLIEVDLDLLQEAAGQADQLTSVAIILNEGEDVAAFCQRHSAKAEGLPEALTVEPADRVRAGFDRQVSASRFGFVVASMLTFMSAAFIIVTAMTTSVTQRQRELAVTRCVGASRGQLFASQMMGGLLVAVIGAVIGVPLGIGLTWLLYLWFSEFLPAGVAIHPLGLQLSLIGAVASGVIGALYPAWLASHVAPLQAMTVHARPVRAISIIIALLIALSLVGLHLALLTIDDVSTRFLWYAYVGLPAAQAGYFVLASPVIVLAALLVAPLLELVLRLPSGMLRRSVLATPFRHGFTAGALMVGMALLVSSWSNATSLLEDWLGKIKFADAFAYRSAGIPLEQQRAIEALPFVEQTCPIGYMPVRVIDRQIFGVRGLAPPNITVMGFDVDRFFDLNAVEWVAGEPDRAIAKLKDGSGLIVADRFLHTQRVKIGDRLKLGSGGAATDGSGEGSGGVRAEFEIVGAINSAGLDIVTQLFGIRSQYLDYSISCVFLDMATVERVFDNHDVLILQANLRGDITDEEATKIVEQTAPGVAFRSGRKIMDDINEIAVGALAVQTTVAFAALVLASLGVGNVILANIHGRRYEYGVLRAVGGQRALLVRLIFGEATLLAITAAIVGTGLGLHLAAVGAMNYRDLAGLPVRWNVPEWPTILGCLTLLALTLLAALPGVLSIVRPQPAALLAGGRHG
jgi:putative ABC transport system permease protein